MQKRLQRSSGNPSNSISQESRNRHLRTGLVNAECMEELITKSLFEELGGTYTLGENGMLYPDLTLEAADSRPIGKWGRM